MDHIETKILNSYTIQEAAQNMVFAARLTQQGHSIQNMDDLMALYQKSFTDKTVDRIASLPHPTVQKFTVITVAIVGASRRFLAQITRHQNEVKFMSASLQYSNYSEKAAFVIPYEILFSEQRYIDLYLQSCLSDLRCYQELCSVGFHHDSAGYALPHALRNILIICATPYEWKHMISQRICRRNTDETRIVMLDIWQKLYEFDPVLFSPKLTGPFCQRGCCEEGAMSCGIPIPKDWSPLEIMKADYIKYRAMFATMYSSGMRVSEVIHLHYDDISRSNMQIHVRDTKNRMDRYTILSKRCLDILTQYWFEKGRPRGILFPNKFTGNYLTVSTLEQVMRRAVSDAELPKKATPHCLRHSFATHLIEQGVERQNIQALLGHRDPKSTEVYLHVSNKSLMGIQSPFDRKEGADYE